ncbi:MAG: V-type ATP synthase subunit B, partial [Candidatus Aenigmatarchaeota archaeon]
LSDRDEKILEFTKKFEKRFVGQGAETNRTIEESLDLAWELLSIVPESELTRIDPEMREERLPSEEQ